MASGMGIELEEMGVVALVGLLVVPGMVWAAKAKSGGSMLRRTLILAGVVAAALAVEAAMDRSANSVADKLGV